MNSLINVNIFGIQVVYNFSLLHNKVLLESACANNRGADHMRIYVILAQ